MIPIKQAGVASKILFSITDVKVKDHNDLVNKAKIVLTNEGRLPVLLSKVWGMERNNSPAFITWDDYIGLREPMLVGLGIETQ